MNIIILLADIHAYLDSIKSNFDVLSHRTDIHENIIKILLRYLNTDMNFIKFVQGTSFQLNSSYTLDMYKFGGLSPANISIYSVGAVRAALCWPSASHRMALGSRRTGAWRHAWRRSMANHTPWSRCSSIT